MTGWVLWGRADCTSGEPIKMMDGTLGQVRREARFRRLHEHRPRAFHDLRLRKVGQPYDTGTPYRVPQPLDRSA